MIYSIVILNRLLAMLKSFKKKHRPFNQGASDDDAVAEGAPASGVKAADAIE